MEQPMAKTDDPLFDLQQQVTAQQQTINELKNTVENLAASASASQAFINDKFHDELSSFWGVIGWHQNELEKASIKRRVERASWELKQYGYSVTKDEEKT
jgi:hypothetical protein